MLLAYGKEVVEASPPFMGVVEQMLQANRGTQEQFWRQQMMGIDAANEMALVKPTEPQSTSTCVCELDVPVEAVQSAAAAMGVTIATLMNGAWALLLHVLSGDYDVVFGVVSSGRSGGGLAEQTVGLLINTLPLRVAVGGEVSARQWLQTVQSQFNEMLVHESTSLGDIQEWCDVHPLFDTTVDFVNYPEQEDTLDQCGFEMEVLDAVEKTDLLLSLSVEVQERVELSLMYDKTRVRDRDAKSILECIQCMVGWLVGSEGEEELSVGLEQMQRLLPSSEQP